MLMLLQIIKYIVLFSFLSILTHTDNCMSLGLQQRMIKTNELQLIAKNCYNLLLHSLL